MPRNDGQTLRAVHDSASIGVWVPRLFLVRLFTRRKPGTTRTRATRGSSRPKLNELWRIWAKRLCGTYASAGLRASKLASQSCVGEQEASTGGVVESGIHVPFFRTIGVFVNTNHVCPTRALKPMASSSMAGVHTVATPPGSPFHTSSTQKVADDALPIEPYSGAPRLTIFPTKTASASARDDPKSVAAHAADAELAPTRTSTGLRTLVAIASDRTRISRPLIGERWHRIQRKAMSSGRFLAARRTVGRGPEPTVLAQIGEIALPKRGRVLRVALVDWGNDFGIGVDVRVFVTDAAHERRRVAQGRAAISGRRFNGSHRSGFVGPTKQGVLLQPGDADELSELLAEAVVKVEAQAAPGAPDPFWLCSRSTACRQRGYGDDYATASHPRLSSMRGDLPLGDADGPEDLRRDSGHQSL
jgi:hypothetical protein